MHPARPAKPNRRMSDYLPASTGHLDNLPLGITQI
jgi:hypothetical protein